MKLQVIVEHVSDEMHILHDQNAFRSSLVHDCIERGKSLIEGGAVYTADGGPTAGTISIGNAFAAIEYSIFDKKLITAQQLKHALDTNFEDASTSPSGEEIRQLLVNKAPKFGNDDDYADRWSVEIADFIGSKYHQDFKSSRYGKGPGSRNLRSEHEFGYRKCGIRKISRSASRRQKSHAALSTTEYLLQTEPKNRDLLPLLTRKQSFRAAGVRRALFSTCG